MRYGQRGHTRRGRRDANEPEIVAALTAVGAIVLRIDAAQPGEPDLCVGYRGRWELVEVKRPPGKRGGISQTGQHLSDDQKEWHERAIQRGLPVRVWRTVSEAMSAIGVELVVSAKGRGL